MLSWSPADKLFSSEAGEVLKVTIILEVKTTVYIKTLAASYWRVAVAVLAGPRSVLFYAVSQLSTLSLVY